jgi:hypothetical protein
VALNANVVQWAGLWCHLAPDLSASGNLRFKAKAEHPLHVGVSLTDRSGCRAEAQVRVAGGAWQRFSLPISVFRKAPNQTPGIPESQTFDRAHIVTAAFGGAEPGNCAIFLGPVESAPSEERVTGGMNPDSLQDFVALGANAFGPFADVSSSIRMDILQNKPGDDAVSARFDYQLSSSGWCGEWIRAGDDWNGVNLTHADALKVEVRSAEVLSLRMAFNDAHQNAYVSSPVSIPKGDWTVLRFPITSFSLNPYYQPPLAEKGAPLDLSKLEAFNIEPLTPGRHVFWVRSVVWNAKP